MRPYSSGRELILLWRRPLLHCSRRGIHASTRALQVAGKGGAAASTKPDAAGAATCSQQTLKLAQETLDSAEAHLRSLREDPAEGTRCDAYHRLVRDVLLEAEPSLLPYVHPLRQPTVGGRVLELVGLSPWERLVTSASVLYIRRTVDPEFGTDEFLEGARSAYGAVLRCAAGPAATKVLEAKAMERADPEFGKNVIEEAKAIFEQFQMTPEEKAEKTQLRATMDSLANSKTTFPHQIAEAKRLFELTKEQMTAMRESSHPMFRELPKRTNSQTKPLAAKVAEREFVKNLAKMVSTEVARRTLLMNVSGAYGDHRRVIGSAHQILAAEIAAVEMRAEDFYRLGHEQPFGEPTACVAVTVRFVAYEDVPPDSDLDPVAMRATTDELRRQIDDVLAIVPGVGGDPRGASSEILCDTSMVETTERLAAHVALQKVGCVRPPSARQLRATSWVFEAPVLRAEGGEGLLSGLLHKLNTRCTATDLPSQVRNLFRAEDGEGGSPLGDWLVTDITGFDDDDTDNNLPLFSPDQNQLDAIQAAIEEDLRNNN